MLLQKYIFTRTPDCLLQGLKKKKNVKYDLGSHLFTSCEYYFILLIKICLNMLEKINVDQNKSAEYYLLIFC